MADDRLPSRIVPLLIVPVRRLSRSLDRVRPYASGGQVDAVDRVVVGRGGAQVSAHVASTWRVRRCDVSTRDVSPRVRSATTSTTPTATTDWSRPERRRGQ